MRSADGPVESATIRRPAGHYFCADIESLTWDSKNTHDPGSAAATSRAGRDSVQGTYDGRDGRDGTDGFAVRHFQAEAERRHHRPNTAPAYYLGHPAALWITITRPGRTAHPQRQHCGVAGREGHPPPHMVGSTHTAP
jgi:hypothetical protein